MSSCNKSRICGLVGVIVVAALLATAFSVTSQPPMGKTVTAADTAGQVQVTANKDASAKPAPGGEEKSPQDKQGTATLPLKRVVLFSSGVGYFEHDGKVTDNAKVDLKFKVKDINDLLKSMVVQDFDGGHVSTVGYGSNDPLDKRLSSFAINLNGNPALAQLLEQVRGEKVEIDAPNKIVGTIVSIETRKTEVGKDHFIDQTVTERAPPTAACGAWSWKAPARSGCSTPSSTPSCTRPWPCWPPPTRPTRRPSRSISAARAIARVARGLHRGNAHLEDQLPPGAERREEALPAGLGDRREPDRSGLERRAAVAGQRAADFLHHGPLSADVHPAARRPTWNCSARCGPQTYEQDMAQAATWSSAALAERGRGIDRGPGPGRRADDAGDAHGRGARPRPQAARFCRTGPPMNLNQGVESAATAGNVGELFQYAIRTPVTLSRHESAMLPIVNSDVKAEKFSIYNPAVQAKHPLERPEAHELHQPAPDAGPDHGLRRRHLCRRRHDPGHPARQRAADQLRPGSRHRSGPREQEPAGADHAASGSPRAR